MTPLMHAVMSYYQIETVKVLIEAGADVNAKDNYGVTAIMWAAALSSYPQVIDALIKAGAKIDERPVR